MELQELLQTLQELNEGQKIRKNSLAVKLTRILDVMVSDEKISFDGEYYFSETKDPCLN